MTNIRRSSALFLGALLFALGVRVGSGLQSPVQFSGTTSGSGTVLSDPRTEADLSLLWQVWNVLSETYVDPEELTDKKLIQGAAAGLVRGVGDPYTVFLTQKDAVAFDQMLSGTLEGIGAELETEEGAIRVAKPLTGSPAEKAGLKTGDFIIEVDGESTEGWNLEEVISHVRGPRGTTVVLTLLREGRTAPLKMSIVRAQITIPSLETSTKQTASGTVAVIALRQFGAKSVTEVEAAVRNAQKANAKGIVLDLRGNGGGYLDGAVGLTSLFVEEGLVVSVEGRNKELEKKSVTGGAFAADIPLVVLIDGGSASASEIVAGALQDHKRATIVGEHSFGKGTVQQIYELKSGDSIKVTIAHWITPGGKNLGKEFIQPDIEVKLTEAATPEKDPQMDAALRAVFRPVGTK